jgi:fatty acid desaturase
MATRKFTIKMMHVVMIFLCRWFRRDLHLKHHMISGQIDDAEERLVGLGEPWGFKRMAAAVHPFGALIMATEVGKDAAWLDVSKLNLTSAPAAAIFVALNKALAVYAVAYYLYGDSFGPYIPAQYFQTILDLNILWCLPNILRGCAIILLTTCSHYYGDIPQKSVFFQNQILDHWTLYPLQILAFNFGTGFMQLKLT